MATELEKEFQNAAQEAQQLSRRPADALLLKLYSLYKQATSGDASGKRPGFTDPVGRAKFDAWSQNKGMSREKAMQAYIDLVKQLKK